MDHEEENEEEENEPRELSSYLSWWDLFLLAVDVDDKLGTRHKSVPSSEISLIEQRCRKNSTPIDGTEGCFVVDALAVVETCGDEEGPQKQTRLGLYPSYFIAFARETSRAAYSIVISPSHKGLPNTIATSFGVISLSAILPFFDDKFDEDEVVDDGEMIDFLLKAGRLLLCF